MNQNKPLKNSYPNTVEKEKSKSSPEVEITVSKLSAKIGDEAISLVEETIDINKQGAKTLEETAVKAAKVIGSQPSIKKARKFWHGLGPGFTTGAADDDPSGIGTYSQTGAQYGYQLLWLAPLTLPLMAIVQEMCARIGLVTGRGLAANIKKYFPKSVSYICAILLLVANSFNIGANLGAMAQSAELIVPWLPFGFLVLAFTGICLCLQIFIPYQNYARYLKYLALVLLAYIATAFVIKDFPWGEVLRDGLMPSLNFSKTQIILICGILGTTISPYLFFWETSQEVEEKIASGKTSLIQRQEVDKKQIRTMRLDVWIGMILSNLVMFFIIAVCGATLFKAGINNIETASDAALALKPLAGNYAFLLFAIGIIGTGLLAIPVLAGSAAYAVSESFGWKEGLYLKFRQGIYFYSIIILSVLIGLGINFIGFNPIKALIYAAVINGLVAPVVLVLILLISGNRQIMNHYHNSSLQKVFGWGLAGLMLVVNIIAIVSLI